MLVSSRSVVPLTVGLIMIHGWNRGHRRHGRHIWHIASHFEHCGLRLPKVRLRLCVIQNSRLMRSTLRLFKAWAHDLIKRFPLSRVRYRIEIWVAGPILLPCRTMLRVAVPLVTVVRIVTVVK